MSPSLPARLAAPLLALLLPLAACQGESTSGVDSSDSVSLRGTVSTATPVKGAAVRLYALNDDGSRGDLLASTTSDDDGRWKVQLEERLDVRPLLVESGGGRYRELDSGIAVDAGDMRGMVVTGAGVAAVTPLSSIAAARVLDEMARGTVRETAMSSIGYEFLVRVGVNPLMTPPATAPWESGPAAAYAHAALLAAADRLTGDRLAPLLPGSSRFRLLQAVVEDTGNGYIDGLDIYNDPVGIDAASLPSARQFTGAANRFLAAHGIDRVAISLTGLNQLAVAPAPRRNRDEPCGASAWFAGRAGAYAMDVVPDGGLEDDRYAGSGPWDLFIAADGTVTLETDLGLLVMTYDSGDSYTCPPAHQLRISDAGFELGIAQLRDEDQVLYVTLSRAGKPLATYITARRY